MRRPLVNLYHVRLERKAIKSFSVHRNANDLFWNKNVVSRRQPLLSDGYYQLCLDFKSHKYETFLPFHIGKSN
jgi:hypothetical protein